MEKLLQTLKRELKEEILTHKKKDTHDAMPMLYWKDLFFNAKVQCHADIETERIWACGSVWL